MSETHSHESNCRITPAAQRVIDQAEQRAGETLDEASRRVAIDALYETRNDGGTMHDAGAAAADAVLAVLRRLPRDRNPGVD